MRRQDDKEKEACDTDKEENDKQEEYSDKDGKEGNDW